MPYITAGDPSGVTLCSLVAAMADAGADIIEIGFPFSDPIADGPVISSAMHRALAVGMTPEDVFSEVAKARAASEIALVGMVSESIVTHIGRARFVGLAAESGFDGLIVPDTDLDEIRELEEACSRSDLALIPLVAPTSTPARQELITAHASGFIYLLARAGITGERSDAPEIGSAVEQLRTMTELPICVGFGISDASHVATVGETADGAIIGSALVRRLHEAAEQGHDVIATASGFISELRGA